MLGDCDRQRNDSRGMVHDDKDRCLGALAFVILDDPCLVIRQRSVLDFDSVFGDGACPMIGFTHVQAEEDFYVTGIHDRRSFELLTNQK